MWSQRTLLAWLVAAAAAGTAGAQPPGGIRWPGPAPHPGLGLQARDAAVLPLYLNRPATRSLSMELVPAEASGPPGPWKSARLQGLNVGLVGQAALPWDLGIYGRLGTTLASAPAPGGALTAAPGHGLHYGVGLSWDFSARGSAILGWDSYDFRTVAGERDVRATSLGLQWKY